MLLFGNVQLPRFGVFLPALSLASTASGCNSCTLRSASPKFINGLGSFLRHVTTSNDCSSVRLLIGSLGYLWQGINQSYFVLTHKIYRVQKNVFLIYNLPNQSPPTTAYQTQSVVVSSYQSNRGLQVVQEKLKRLPS